MSTADEGALLAWFRPIANAECVAHHRPNVAVEFKHLKGSSSSGCYFLYRNYMIVRLGSDVRDQKSTLLHELAHHLLNAQHTPEFWDKAWELYGKYLPASDHERMLQRESRYKATAYKAAEKSGLFTPEALSANRRSPVKSRRSGPWREIDPSSYMDWPYPDLECGHQVWFPVRHDTKRAQCHACGARQCSDGCPTDHKVRDCINWGCKCSKGKEV